MRVCLLFVFFTLSLNTFSQKKKPIPQTLIVKTNILNLAANKPTITFEKAFNKTYSLEATLIQGEFNNILLTDHYAYSGFLLRGKKYFEQLYYEIINPYYSFYVGTLSRTIESSGRSDNTGYLGYSSRSFYGRSLRTGGSLGANYLTKDRFIVDAQASLGYGFYYKQINEMDPQKKSSGYLDVQLWLSVGYCF